MKIKSKFEKTGKHLKGLDARLSANIKKTLDLMGFQIIATSANKYLRGPRPKRLGDGKGKKGGGRGGGRLSTSLTAKVSQKLDKFFLQVGTNIPYARLHEEGLTVPAHIRIIKQAFGRQLKFPVAVNVKSFKMPKRPFLAPAIKDNTKSLTKNLLKAMRLAIEGKLA